ERFGPPPVHVRERSKPAERISLPHCDRTEFDALLARRATCRNFCASRSLPGDLFAGMLMRVFGAQANVAAEGAVFLKKTSPSGGGLHATEAYLIVQNVEGIAPGL